MTTSRRTRPRYLDRQGAASWPGPAGCSPQARIPPIPASTSGRSRTALSPPRRCRPSSSLRAAVPPPLTAPLISPSCRGSVASAADRGPARWRRTMKMEFVRRIRPSQGPAEDPHHARRAGVPADRRRRSAAGPRSLRGAGGAVRRGGPAPPDPPLQVVPRGQQMCGAGGRLVGPSPGLPVTHSVSRSEGLRFGPTTPKSIEPRLTSVDQTNAPVPSRSCG